MAKTNTKHFKVEPLNIKDFIDDNDLELISNPIFFDMNNAPTSDGLLSNQIFGISKEDRAGTFAYISLGKNEVFMHPLFYRVWGKIDRRIKDIVHGTKKYSIDKTTGDFVEDEENGECGLKFLQKSFRKLKIKRTKASSRDAVIDFLYKYQDRMFIENMVIIPAYYRDVTTTGKYVGVGDINQIYAKIMTAAKSLSESYDYGLNLSDSIRGKIQENLGALYDYFTKGVFNGESVTGIAGKFGILRRANLAKTTDYSARIIISPPNLKVENLNDMMVDLDHSAVPMAALTANFYPYLIFYMRRFFENIFSGNEIFPVVNSKTGKIVMTDLSDYMTQFTDDKLKEELDRFSHGSTDRFRPIEIKDVKNNTILHLKFTGINCTKDEYINGAKDELSKHHPIDRKLTWCDLIFLAECEVTKDKCVLITRYPMDSYFNQFPTKIRVSSTIKTKPMIIDNQFYEFYPDIEEKDLNTDTSNKFIDTLMICNLYLDSITGDYDGDQVSCKSIYSIEANAELQEQMNSNSHYIGLSGACILKTDIEGAQALYNLTLVLSEDKKKLSDPEF